MKTKIITFFTFAFIAINVFASDAYLTGLTLGNYLKANYNYDIIVKIRNANNSPITSCKINWQLDNGTVSSQQINIGGGGITTSTSSTITHATKLNVANAGSYKFKVWISDVYEYDNNHANDTISKDILILSNYVNNKVLIEEYTATTCQYCPAGNAVINTIATNPNAVVAAFHSSDAYSLTEGMTYMQSLGAAATPVAIINMGEMGNYPISTQYNLWQTEVTSRIGISPVDIQFTPVYNATTRLLTINSTVNFKHALTGDFYLNVYVLESGISGTQTNATNPYIHNHVVRKLLGGVNGFSGVIPVQPVANTNYTHQDTLTIPTAWNANNLEIIAYVFEKNTSNQKNVLNAAKYSYYVGIDDIPSNTDFTNVYPNPVSDEMYLKFNERKDVTVSVYTIEGKMQIEQKFTNTEECLINTSQLSKGIYIVKVSEKNNVQNIKIIKQ